MSEKKAIARRPRRVAPRDALGPGIHAGVVELGAGREFRVRTTSGGRVSAGLADGVERALIEECLRTARHVFVCDSERGPIILGAMQTALSPSVSPDGTLALSAKTLRLRAERTIELDVGASSIALKKNGVIEMRGDRMVVNVAALIRFLAARVELP